MRIACLALLLFPALAAAQAPTVAPGNAPVRVTLHPSGEPGSALTISGVIYAADGRTPLRRASVYVYQTDAKGYYAPDDARASGNPRLRGYMRTDSSGRYEFHTIRPGSYPGSRNPGHIHYHVNAPGYEERVFEIVFDDDPLIPEQWRREATRPNSGVAIVKLSRNGAGWKGVQNVTLRKS